MSDTGVQLRVKGKVQGVGFRPYVWQLAQKLSLKGDVVNDAEGVLIRLLSTHYIDFFQDLLYQECPPLAQIDTIICSPFLWCEPPLDFTIRQSENGMMDTQIIPDAATCHVCLSELFDQQNRRYTYPFINCTHCGPRFTIIKKMPYDRANTSMATFALCEMCLKEYQLPTDRRFHAQPNACSECGPHIWSCFEDGLKVSEGQKALTQAAHLLLAGGIVAIKGIGGFHLACDATNNSAVALLRHRKQRPSKPFAVMLADLCEVDKYVNINYPLAKQLLTSAAGPIVLMSGKPDSTVSDLVAPDLSELGVMLPTNPLQHLLARLVGRPLVMTSGNPSGKPPALSNERALFDLVGVADMWLLHNRDIVQRADDSLLRCNEHGVEMLRRARGFVPDALALPNGFASSPSILAMGADLKNTFCLLRDKSAVVSAHLGDLEDIEIQNQFHHSLDLFCDIYRFSPQALVVDAHPSYISHQIGLQLAQKLNIPVFNVFHHHAHIAACLVEHHWPRNAGAVIGIAIDGLGYGPNDKLWGGECLLADYQRCDYLGGLPAVALPGGNLASKQPWRNLFAQVMQFVPQWQQYPEMQRLLDKNLSLLQTAMTRNINSPLASSGGRLFDAVAAALGICFDSVSWEGEAACKLEVLASKSHCTNHPVTMPITGNQLDLSAFWHQWLNYQASPPDKAYAFHDALAEGFATLAQHFAKQHHINTIVLTGGVMHNRLFRQLLLSKLSRFNVLYAQILPMGDGGLSLGQAIIGIDQWFLSF